MNRGWSPNLDLYEKNGLISSCRGIVGISETNYLSERYFHIASHGAQDLYNCITIRHNKYEHSFNAPNLLRLNSKYFVVSNSNELYPIWIDGFVIKQEINASNILATWHSNSYFNILIKDGATHKHRIFGRMSGKTIKYMSRHIRNFIISILLCFKNVALHLQHKYTHDIPTQLFINSILPLCFE